jgi:acyl-homoserine-lactone acylase
MKKLSLVFAAIAVACAPQAASDKDVMRWGQLAQNVSIVRDDWGIPHVFGRSDADAVFGIIYAQAEDDFNRVETNFINGMGRLAEAEGEEQVIRDLRMKLFIDPADIKTQYEKSPAWLKTLMEAWADGLNYFLYKHPDAKPRVIRHFEPWMALTFSEGSIGGDIERVNLADLQAFYGKDWKAKPPAEEDDLEDGEPRGSNGIAIAPSNTTSKHALLLINPHTSFFFRAEAQMVSEEGLNSYGAITWGQFFIYQGFNDRAGWMHTSSGVDNIDEYQETIVRKGERLYYKYGAEERPVTVSTIVVPYKTAAGVAEKTFTVYRTHHGPIVREAGGKWISVRLMQEPVKALTQSYSRTKARSYKDFRQSMELHTNSSNNTVYADADGNIAYFHSNFIPKRDPAFDWTRPVDGSNPTTEWRGVMSIDETPGVFNPPNGWLYNVNNSPWSAAGPNSPRKGDFPSYVESGSENPRAVHAIRVLENKTDFTLTGLISAAYDTYLPEFDVLIPGLVKAYDHLPASSPIKSKLASQVAALRNWDRRWSVESAPAALAIYWGEDLWQRATPEARKAGVSVYEFIETRATRQQKLGALAAAAEKLATDFGKWNTPWGEINRFQRLTGDLVQPFNDDGPSVPVGFASGRWGSLASFGARTYPGTRRMYGTSGNSFVAVVEFGDRVQAKAVTAGGESGNPASPHFNDQAKRYSTGDLRDVYFYREQLQGHIEREYKPCF